MLARGSLSEPRGGTDSASNWFGSIRSASRSNVLYSGTSSSGMYSFPLSPMTGSSTVTCQRPFGILLPAHVRRGYNIPQKKLPGFVAAWSLTSLPIFPTACTACALGMYPVSSMSNLFRSDCCRPSYSSSICSADVLVPLTCLYAVWLPMNNQPYRTGQS